MAASKLKLMFLILLSLQLSAIFSKKHDGNNGMSMALHMKRKSKPRKEIERLYYPTDFIEYYIKLSLGTPAQDLLLVIDTGSSMVWAPCTTNYTCYKDCPGFSTVFLPNKSYSSVPLKCADPKCKDVCGDVRCLGSINDCPGACPDYAIQYGTGSTTGHLLTETLTLPLKGGGRREIKNFQIGCSVVSSVFAGIAGSGRGGLSMPSQLSHLLGNNFAYYLDNQKNSSMIMLGDISVPKNIALNYTHFLSMSEEPSFRPYNKSYYVGLKGVSIGGKHLKLPSHSFTINSNGNGGTIIDSGTSYTIFPEAIYSQIVDEFVSQIGYRRSPDVEDNSSFGLCYNVSGTVENIQFPSFSFHFKGGSHMVLPDGNSFVPFSSDTFCLAMLNTRFLTAAVGPAVLIGNYIV